MGREGGGLAEIFPLPPSCCYVSYTLLGKEHWTERDQISSVYKCSGIVIFANDILNFILYTNFSQFVGRMTNGDTAWILQKVLVVLQ